MDRLIVLIITILGIGTLQSQNVEEGPCQHGRTEYRQGENLSICYNNVWYIWGGNRIFSPTPIPKKKTEIKVHSNRGELAISDEHGRRVSLYEEITLYPNKKYPEDVILRTSINDELRSIHWVNDKGKPRYVGSIFNAYMLRDIETKEVIGFADGLDRDHAAMRARTQTTYGIRDYEIAQDHKGTGPWNTNKSNVVNEWGIWYDGEKYRHKGDPIWE